VSNLDAAFDGVAYGLNEYETLIRLNSEPKMFNFGLHLNSGRDIQWLSVNKRDESSEIHDVSNDDLKRFCTETLLALGVTELPKKVPTAVLTFTVEYQGGAAEDATTAVQDDSYLASLVEQGIRRELEAGIWSRYRVGQGQAKLEEKPEIPEW
jgi:hypothetical protein